MSESAGGARLAGGHRSGVEPMRLGHGVRRVHGAAAAGGSTCAAARSAVTSAAVTRRRASTRRLMPGDGPPVRAELRARRGLALVRTLRRPTLEGGPELAGRRSRIRRSSRYPGRPAACRAAGSCTSRCRSTSSGPGRLERACPGRWHDPAVSELRSAGRRFDAAWGPLGVDGDATSVRVEPAVRHRLRARGRRHRRRRRPAPRSMHGVRTRRLRLRRLRRRRLGDARDVPAARGRQLRRARDRPHDRRRRARAGSRRLRSVDGRREQGSRRPAPRRPRPRDAACLGGRLGRRRRTRPSDAAAQSSRGSGAAVGVGAASPASRGTRRPPSWARLAAVEQRAAESVVRAERRADESVALAVQRTAEVVVLRARLDAIRRSRAWRSPPSRGYSARSAIGAAHGVPGAGPGRRSVAPSPARQTVA